LNIYDDVTENSSDKGIFVLHFKDIYSGQNNIRCKTSDGQWNWISTGIASCFDGSNNVREWEMTSVNRAGNNRRDKLSYSGTWDWIWSIEDEGCAGYPYGANSENAFNLTNNNVFSPASNPYSATWDNIAEDFTMEIFNQSGSILNAGFYIANPFDGRPSKTQNLTVAWYNNHPKIIWDTNAEPDMKEYKIWKYVDGSSMVVATITHSPSITTHTWTDNSVSPAGKFDPVYTYSYKVKAVDISNLESLYSNQVSISGTGGIWKINGEEDTNADITSYALDSNFPNPFNPTTQISYQLPENSFVNLVVYNIIGQKVAELVNQEQTSGKYTVKFDASNLPSGVYIYKLQAGEFSDVKKMLLTK
jgi:hypothetical protein